MAAIIRYPPIFLRGLLFWFAETQRQHEQHHTFLATCLIEFEALAHPNKIQPDKENRIKGAPVDVDPLPSD